MGTWGRMPMVPVTVVVEWEWNHTSTSFPPSGIFQLYQKTVCGAGGAAACAGE